MNRARELQRRIYRHDKSSEDRTVKQLSRIYIRKGAAKIFRKLRGSQSGKHAEETVEQLCRRMNAEPVDALQSGDGLDAKVNSAALAAKKLKKGGALFLANKSADDYASFVPRGAEAGASVIFVDRKEYMKSQIQDCGYPVALTDNVRQAAAEYCREYRDAFRGTVIGITGSYGKTTTKHYIGAVLKKKYPTYVSPANDNSSYDVADGIIRKMNSGYRAYVQEAGAALRGTVATSALVMRPDIAVITNIKDHGSGPYGGFSYLIEDKMQLIDQLADKGTAVVNFDDEVLSGYDYTCNVAAFGIDTDKELFCRGKNIRQEGGTLHMDVECSGQTVSVHSDVIGKVNAYNILAAFTVGRLMGISADLIAEGISEYSSAGTRQNLTEYGQNRFFVDCYNVGNETIINAVRTLEELETADGGRKIAVIGGENKLGEQRVEKTVELGEKLASSDVDEIVCFGSDLDTEAALDKFGDAPLLAETLKKCGFDNVKLILKHSELAEYLEQNVKPKDAVLFKCIVYLNVPAAIDKAFGTGFSPGQRIVKNKAVMKKEHGLTGFVIKDMDEAFITDADRKVRAAAEIRIPDSFDGHPVYGIKKGTFAYSDAETVDFGNSIKHIGTGAFAECRNLQEVNFPDSVKYIGEGAFRNCRALRTVKLGAGVRNVCRNAFADCRDLQVIYAQNPENIRFEAGAVGSDVRIAECSDS